MGRRCKRGCGGRGSVCAAAARRGKIPDMRGGLWLVAAWCCCSACGGEAVAAPVGDGVLVIEVGGENASLRASLVARGIAVEPPRSLATPDAGAGQPTYGGAIEPPSAPIDAPRDPEQPATRPDAPALDGPPVSPQPAAPRFTTVTLGKGETLIHLAKRHLGDGRRFSELLELNGWSDADARRLRAGQAVKIPVATDGARR